MSFVPHYFQTPSWLVFFVIGLGVSHLLLKQPKHQKEIRRPLTLLAIAGIVGSVLAMVYGTAVLTARLSYNESSVRPLDNLSSNPGDSLESLLEATLLNLDGGPGLHSAQASLHAGESPTPGPAPFLSTESTTAATPLSIEEFTYHGPKLEATRKTFDQGAKLDAKLGVKQLQNDEIEIVVASQRFATIDEAIAQGWPRLQHQFTSHLARTRPEIGNWKPTLDDVKAAGGLDKELHVTWPLEVGGFTEPVYQVFWRARLTNETRERLFQEARPMIVHQRLERVGGAFALAWGALGLLAFAWRRK